MALADLDSLTETEIERDGTPLPPALGSQTRGQPRLPCRRRRLAAHDPGAQRLTITPFVVPRRHPGADSYCRSMASWLFCNKFASIYPLDIGYG